MRRRSRILGIVLLLGSSSGCALTAGTVTRVADGVEQEQSAVPTEAYAYYARGVVLEQRGELSAALSSYRAAVAEDPGSAELSARVGSVECKLAQGDGDAHARNADASFARAFELDPSSSNAWALAAHCAARRQRFSDALEKARRAASFDPDSVELSLLVVDYAERSAELTVARVWLDALVARAPESREAWRAALAFARRHGDVVRRLRAERALAGLSAPVDGDREVVSALREGDLERARRAATRLRISAGGLALLAARESDAALAAKQATIALSADPSDTDAWVAALVAADLSGDRAAFEQLLGEEPPTPSPPNPLALELLGSLIERFVGADARRAWNPEPPRSTTQSR